MAQRFLRAAVCSSNLIFSNESQAVRSRIVVPLLSQGMHTTPNGAKSDLLKRNDLREQQIEQRRYIWPFTKKGFCEMSFRQVEDLVIAKNSIIIDCRRHDEIAESGKIPYAEIVPVEELEEGFQLDPQSFKSKYGFKKPDQHDQIVVYCRSGRRAASACHSLVHMGYDHVCRYEGSWLEWDKKNIHH